MPEEHVFDLRWPSFKCLFIGPIPPLLFLAIATIIWKPSSFNNRNNHNDHNDLDTMIAAIVAIIWKPGLSSTEDRAS